MKKPYFSKFLAVDEPIKDGDFCITTNSNRHWPAKIVNRVGDGLETLNGEPFLFENTGFKRVKMFLCSNNILLGDTYYHDSYHPYPYGDVTDTNTKVMNANAGYAATVAWKLCWEIPQVWIPASKTSNFNNYGMVNFLTDGWFYSIGSTYIEVCEYLNNNPHGEKFRLMTKEEVVYLITNRNQGFL